MQASPDLNDGCLSRIRETKDNRAQRESHCHMMTQGQDGHLPAEEGDLEQTLTLSPQKDSIYILISHSWPSLTPVGNAILWLSDRAYCIARKPRELLKGAAGHGTLHFLPHHRAVLIMKCPKRNIRLQK